MLPNPAYRRSPFILRLKPVGFQAKKIVTKLFKKLVRRDVMNPIPKTIPVSDLRFNQAELLDNLAAEPVLLTRQGKAAAVLVDPEQWNTLLARLEFLDDSITALQAKLELLTEEDDTLSWDSVNANLCC